MRGVAGLVAAVMLVLVGGLFAITEASASPPASRVLSDARDYARGATTLTYQADETAAVPTGSSALLVRHRAVKGTTRFATGNDMEIGEGAAVHQYIAASGDPGIWVRANTPSTPVELAGWIRARDYATFEAALLKRSDPATVRDATFADRIVDGRMVPTLLAASHGASRHGSSVRHVDVTIDPAAVFGAEGAQIQTMTGELVADSHDHPTGLVVHLRTGQTTIDVTYALRWGGPVTITPPAASDVVASL